MTNITIRLHYDKSLVNLQRPMQSVVGEVLNAIRQMLKQIMMSAIEAATRAGKGDFTERELESPEVINEIELLTYNKQQDIETWGWEYDVNDEPTAITGWLKIHSTEQIDLTYLQRQAWSEGKIKIEIQIV